MASASKRKGSLVKCMAVTRHIRLIGSLFHKHGTLILEYTVYLDEPLRANFNETSPLASR